MNNNQLPSFYLEDHKSKLYQEIMEKQFRNGGENMKFKYKLAVGAMAVFVLAFATFGLNKQTPVATAQEVINQVEEHIESLSSEDRQKLQAEFKADLMSTLSEAKAATDLRFMSDTEVEERLNQKGVSVSYDATPEMDLTRDDAYLPKNTDTIQENEIFDMPIELQKPDFPGKGLKILSYTDNVGRIIFLGVNSEEKPVMKITLIDDQEVMERISE